MKKSDEILFFGMKKSDDILFFGMKKPDDILFFGMKKPDNVLFFGMKPDDILFFEIKDHDDVLFFGMKKPDDILFLGENKLIFWIYEAVAILFYEQKKPSSFYFSTICHYWIESYNLQCVALVFLPCIWWPITEYCQFHSVAYLKMATAGTGGYTQLYAFSDQGQQNLRRTCISNPCRRNKKIT
jgi:hypothetical protein